MRAPRSRRRVEPGSRRSASCRCRSPQDRRWIRRRRPRQEADRRREQSYGEPAAYACAVCDSRLAWQIRPAPPQAPLPRFPASLAHRQEGSGRSRAIGPRLCLHRLRHRYRLRLYRPWHSRRPSRLDRGRLDRGRLGFGRHDCRRLDGGLLDCRRLSTATCSTAGGSTAACSTSGGSTGAGGNRDPDPPGGGGGSSGGMRGASGMWVPSGSGKDGSAFGRIGDSTLRAAGTAGGRRRSLLIRAGTTETPCGPPAPSAETEVPEASTSDGLGGITTFELGGGGGRAGSGPCRW